MSTPAAGSARPVPRARLRLSLPELLELYGALGRSVIDGMTVEELTADEHGLYALHRRLARVIYKLANETIAEP